MRVLGRIARAAKSLDFQLMSSEYKDLSSNEKANIRKIASELAMISLLYLSYALAGGDDDDENVALRYGLRRSISEMSYFFNPFEAAKIATTPTASVGVASKLMAAFGQLPNWDETYVQGDNKGRSKLAVKWGKLIPIKSAYERDIGESLKWLNNPY